ncbi:MAG: hypothetical protein ACD_68C00073G0002 [uncultured bacterium]|nr:MAG: hypothetical protein ACD_68C00073G0002 [uncultured bacterium]
MAKYKVEYDREACIGALTCTVAFPEVFKIGDDKKADMAGSKKNGSGQYEIEFPDDQLEKFKAAAEVCPVNVIHITNLDSGEKII